MKQFLPGDKEEEKDEVDDFGPSSFNRMRKFIWELFEEPNKTKLGKVPPPYFKTIRHDIISCTSLVVPRQIFASAVIQYILFMGVISIDGLKLEQR